MRTPPWKLATHLLDALIGQPGTAVRRLRQGTTLGRVEIEHRGAHLATLGAGRLSLLKQQGSVKVV